ncbi:MAG TPA: response regulator transcription factor [Ktedonobacteraceae bacterium]
MKLLIVDTDRDQVEMLTSWLKTQGYEVCRAYTGERARQEWQMQQPDLVIIDPTLPDLDGLVLCREMRIKHDALILVMMDGKNVQDEIRCLDLGADDYLQKPFFPAQFLAHLRAVSRRGRSSLVQRPSSVVTIGSIRIDSLHNEVTIDNKAVRLTPTESKLLHLLAVNANHVCTANQIVAHIWGFGNDGDAGLIKAHIRHLRQKIECDPSHPTYILTVPGVGYTLARHSEKSEIADIKDLARTLRIASL